jgi:chromosome segregation ATPase
MRHTLSLIIAFLGATGFSNAQEQNSAEAKLREALKQLTARVQTAESDAATAKALQTDAEAKNKDLAAKLDKALKDAAADKTEAEKDKAALQGKIEAVEGELARTKESLDKWKAAHAQVTELGKKAEAGRVALVAKSAALANRAADLERKNLALFKIGSDVLTRLENFSYGTALAAREPFVGTARVKLENEVQSYKDKLLDPKLKP